MLLWGCCIQNGADCKAVAKPGDHGWLKSALQEKHGKQGIASMSQLLVTPMNPAMEISTVMIRAESGAEAVRREPTTLSMVVVSATYDC